MTQPVEINTQQQTLDKTLAIPDIAVPPLGLQNDAGMKVHLSHLL